MVSIPRALPSATKLQPFRLDWNAVTDATNYEVEKQLVGTDPDFSVAGSTGSTTHQFGGFSGGSIVRVRIRAFGTTGPSGTPTSPYSEVAEIIFP